MKLAVFGRPSDATKEALQVLANYSKENNDTLLIHKFLMPNAPKDPSSFTIFDKHSDFLNIDLAMSIGGDGTFIRLSRMVAPFAIPVVGINTGRLGFLADICVNKMMEVIQHYKAQETKIEERTLLELNSSHNCHKDANLAVNEVAVLRRDTSSLLVVKLYANGQFINSYWADGLIISTPTGSTAYSMAAGGPIAHPQCNNLIITPISPHSLTVRPLVINDDVELTIEVESRAETYMVSIDSRSEVVDINEKLVIKKSPYALKVVKDKDYDYYCTLREKLMWGKDKRS